MRVMSNFSYKNASGKIVTVPVIYGDPNRQVASILKKNSENTIPTAPFIACYIKNMEYEQARMQDPTFVSKVNIRERAFDDTTQQYLPTQGAGYTVERMMPVPYKLTFAADIWTTNTDQKLQLWEQISYLFNPSLELQTTDNYVDWTSLTVLQLASTNWSSRNIPQGTEQDIDILNMTFTTPIWITPPAKVKKLGVITKIIANVFSDVRDEIITDYSDPNAVYPTLGRPLFKAVVNPGNFELLVLDNVASLISNGASAASIATSMPSNTETWRLILDLYPGEFRAGLSQIRLTKPDGNEIVAYIGLDPLDEHRMLLTFDPDTVPSNTVIDGRGTVDAIINPETFDPLIPVIGVRYLILENINHVPEYGQPGYDGPRAWKNLDGTDFQASANDIIQWNGANWNIIFNSLTNATVTYITNSYTGIQYKWDGVSWSKSFEGLYDKDLWRLIL
jgi:hypothetical protein